ARARAPARGLREVSGRRRGLHLTKGIHLPLSITPCMNPLSPLPGQRWISDSEPELGLGIIVSADALAVEISFPAANETRRYARGSAPLRRVQFQPGDRLHDAEVLSVEVREGLYYYNTAGG